MYKRDLITAEVQQLVKALAQLLGLKVEGKQEEADQFFEATLEIELDLSTEDLLNIDEEDLKRHLKKQDFKAEKLDLLSQLIYAKIDGFERSAVNQSLASKLLSLYDFIEQEHHISSFENLNRQSRIKRFLRAK